MLDYAMDALRLPARRRRRDQALRRRAPPRRALPAAARAPDLLLLDEPTNHLDAESVAWLERHLDEYKGTVVAVTHDRYFLDNVAGWILELDRGRGIPFEGNYSCWLEQKQERLAAGGEAREVARQRTIAAELEWVRENPKGRRRSRRRAWPATRRCSPRSATSSSTRSRSTSPPGPRLGDVVVEAEDLRKGFGDRLLIEDLSFSLPRGGHRRRDRRQRRRQDDAVPDDRRRGAARRAARCGSATRSSSPTSTSRRDALDAEKTVWEEISDGYDQIKVGDQWMNSRAVHRRASTSRAPTSSSKVGTLSGGERNRLHLAKLLRSGGNLLLLDEPTNDLDVDTLRALEEALLGFAGCAVVISHDRWFLDRVATHVLAFEGDSQVTWFEGNFEAYEEHRHELLGAEADRPHRITYKRLTRS